MKLSSPLSPLLLVCVFGCGANQDFTPAELELVAQMSPIPELPDSPTNQYADDEQAARLGQALFFERAFAGPIAVASDLGAVGETGKIACVDCHSNAPGAGFSDVRSSPNACSNGAAWTPRNSPTVLNLPHYEWFAWEGRGDSVWMKSMQPVEAGISLASTRLRVAHVLFEKYQAEYEAVFGALDPALDAAHPESARFPVDGAPKKAQTDPDGAWEGMTAEDRDIVNRIYANVGKAFEAYFRHLVTGPTPFDDFVAGDDSAISAAAKEGLKLFIGKAACADCHSGPMFTDNEFHNTGVPQTGEHVMAVDDGRYSAIGKLLANPFNTSGPYSDDTSTGKLDDVVAATDADKGKFRTKDLRQIAETGPYMHTGAFDSLHEVVEFYNDGGGTNDFSGNLDPRIVPLNLTADEVDAIVAFLETLTGPVSEDWAENTAKP